MVNDPRRLAALGLCGALLVGLFVLGGMGSPTAPHEGPHLDDPDVAPDEHAGEHAETGGEVIDTDPVVIDVGDGDTTQPLPVENAPDAEEGQELIVDGTLTDEGTLVATPERAVVREPWETTYMYVISVIGALLVAARIVDGWRFDPQSVTFRPRERPLHVRDTEGPPDG
ncbi:hypothetical protein JCM17823_11110 [Halorubrum gandharaense]